jgi:hypothetical protein
MLYTINTARTEGHSNAFDNEDDAILEVELAEFGGLEAWYVKQRYEIDDDGHYDCGDDE